MALKKPSYLIILFLFSSCSEISLGPMGVTQEEQRQILYPCPEGLKCLTSFNTNDPIKVHSPPEETMKNLARIIKTTSGTHIIEKDEKYLRAEFHSFFSLFRDEVELLLAPSDEDSDYIVHFRVLSHSAWELGRHRKIIENIRFRFYQRDFR